MIVRAIYENFRGKIIIKHIKKTNKYSIDLIIRQIIREIINEMVSDVISTTHKNITVHKIKNLNDGIWCISDFSKEIGLLDGDKIISADGVEILRFEDVQEKIVTSKKLTVERSGKTIEVVLPDNVIEKLLNSKEKILVYPRIPPIISDFSEETSLQKNGFLIGDRIIEINGEPVLYFDVLKNKLQRYSDTNIVRYDERDAPKNIA